MKLLGRADLGPTRKARCYCLAQGLEFSCSSVILLVVRALGVLGFMVTV